MKNFRFSLLALLIIMISLPFMHVEAASTSLPLQVQVDGPATVFPGEPVNWYVLVTFNGSLVDTTGTVTLSAEVLKASAAPSPLSLTWIRKGVCYATWTVPTNSSGTHALLVTATKGSDTAYALSSFHVSSWLESRIVAINKTTVDILTPIGVVKRSVDDIKPKVTSLVDRTVTLDTKLGEVRGEIKNMTGSVAMIETKYGNMLTKLDSINAESETTARRLSDLNTSISGSLEWIKYGIIALVGLLGFYLYSQRRQQPRLYRPPNYYRSSAEPSSASPRRRTPPNNSRPPPNNRRKRKAEAASKPRSIIHKESELLNGGGQDAGEDDGEYVYSR